MEKPTFKIAVMGNSKVGKTSLINKYINNSHYNFVSDNADNKKPFVKKVAY